MLKNKANVSNGEAKRNNVLKGDAYKLLAAENRQIMDFSAELCQVLWMLLKLCLSFNHTSRQLALPYD